MKRTNDRELFNELEKWSKEKTSYSINEFCSLKGLTKRELREKAKYRKKFYLIIGQANARLFDNADMAFRNKAITRVQLAEYLKKLGFHDPEGVIQDCEWEMEEPNREALGKALANYSNDPESAQIA